MPRRLYLYRLRILFVVSLIWVIFGVVFYINLLKQSNDLGVRVDISEFAVTFGIIGCIITAILIFVLKPAFSHQPRWFAIIVKLAITLLLFFLIGFVLLMIYFFVHYTKDLSTYFKSFSTKMVYTNTFVAFIVDMGLMTFISIIILEVTDKYGPGMFWIMLSGEYHKPKIENRIFVFLDINESTSIAEQLGHERYFRMQRNFFNDITVPLLANDGEIYQYAGDEVLITWPNTPENKAKCLKFIRNTYYLIERLGPKYERRFSKQPKFKAGIHSGEVTAGLIGLIKRDLLYSGDTMNTTARIRSMCNELNEPFMMSEDFITGFEVPQNYTIENIGTMELKGKTEPIKLYSLRFE